MKRFKRILVSLLVVCTFTISAYAGSGSFEVSVPSWGAWCAPSPSLIKDTTNSYGEMLCFVSNAYLPKYGDFTAGGTSTRISKDYYMLVTTTNTGNPNNWTHIYYKDGYATKGRSVSARACSSNIEPNYNTGFFDWDTDDKW